MEDKIINLNIPSEILWMFLAAILLIFLVMSFIFQHHWEYYGIKDNPKIFAKAVYWIISIFLIIVMLLSVIYFESL